MRVVVTGGAGFIGCNVCRALAATDEVTEVVAFDDLSTGDPASLTGVSKTTLVEGTILDPEALARVITPGTSVVHLAARPSVPRSLADPFASHEANATGTVRVLEAVRGAGGGHVLVASSSSVYGANRTLPKREDLPARPLSPYAASKLATEAYALAYASSFGLDVLAFRFFNVFGPWQPAGHAYAAVIPAFVSAALQLKPLTVHGDGKQTRDFTFVGSVASVITDAVLRGVAHPEPVNLAFGTRTDLLAVIELLEEILARPLDREFTPPRAGDVRDSQADTSTLRSLFPDAQAVPLEVGLRQTVDWLAAAHPLAEGSTQER
jgi:UDP-glucose 4-epimerase